MNNIKRLYKINTETSEECAKVMRNIHDQLVGNTDYIESNIILNDSDTRCDDTVNEIRVYIFKECKNIPDIIIK